MIEGSEQFLDEWKDGRVSFGMGTGRCGTTFLEKLLQNEPEIGVSHERNPLNDTFHRYCAWNSLPVDEEGFLAEKARGIRADLEQNQFSFECSAYLSLSVIPLFERFGARFILLVRHPEAVIRSYLAKGWYAHPIQYRDLGLAPGYQKSNHFHHFFGRIFPRGDDFESWSNLTQAGKLAWSWASLNESVLRQFDRISTENWRIQRLEELDFAAYRRICGFLGLECQLTEKKFSKIQKTRPNQSRLPLPERAWMKMERREIEEQACRMADRFSYKLFNR